MSIWKTSTAISWQGMHNRCYNKNQPVYKYYGAVGVRICESIHSSPKALLDLIGPRPDNRTVDRIDSNGMYSCGRCSECLRKGWPLNVRWATRRQQRINQRSRVRFVTIGGVTKCLMEWSEESGVNYNTLLCRLEYKWPEEKLLQPASKPD